MTHFERTTVLGIGDDVKYYDDGKDGHPEKWVDGKVIAVCDEGFEVQWEDLKEPTEYEFGKVEIQRNQIFDNSSRRIIYEAEGVPVMPVPYHEIWKGECFRTKCDCLSTPQKVEGKSYEAQYWKDKYDQLSARKNQVEGVGEAAEGEERQTIEEYVVRLKNIIDNFTVPQNQGFMMALKKVIKDLEQFASTPTIDKGSVEKLFDEINEQRIKAGEGTIDYGSFLVGYNLKTKDNLSIDPVDHWLHNTPAPEIRERLNKFELDFTEQFNILINGK